MSNCALIALHAVTGRAEREIVAAASLVGWTDQAGGMATLEIWSAAKLLGAWPSPITSFEPSERPTLARFTSQLDPAGRFILLVKDHCIGVVQGRSHDRANTHRRSVVEGFFEVQIPCPCSQ